MSTRRVAKKRGHVSAVDTRQLTLDKFFGGTITATKVESPVDRVELPPDPYWCVVAKSRCEQQLYGSVGWVDSSLHRTDAERDIPGGKLWRWTALCKVAERRVDSNGFDGAYAGICTAGHMKWKSRPLAWHFEVRDSGTRVEDVYLSFGGGVDRVVQFARERGAEFAPKYSIFEDVYEFDFGNVKVYVVDVEKHLVRGLVEIYVNGERLGAAPLVDWYDEKLGELFKRLRDSVGAERAYQILETVLRYYPRTSHVVEDIKQNIEYHLYRG